MKIRGSILFLLCFSWTFTCMGMQSESEFVLYYFPQLPKDTQTTDVLTRLFEKGVENLDEEEYILFLHLKQHQQQTLAHEVAIFHGLRNLKKERPDIPVYVEGLDHICGPMLLCSNRQRSMKAAFRDVDFSALNEAQEVYLITQGAAQVLHAMRELPDLNGCENGTLKRAHQKLDRYLHVPGNLCDDLPTSIIGSSHSTQQYELEPSDEALLLETVQYVDHARRDFAVTRIYQDILAAGKREAALVFTEQQLEGQPALSSMPIVIHFAKSDDEQSSEGEEVPEQSADVPFDGLTLNDHFATYEGKIEETLIRFYEENKSQSVAFFAYFKNECEQFAASRAQFEQFIATATSALERQDREDALAEMELACEIFLALTRCGSAEEFSATVLKTRASENQD